MNKNNITCPNCKHEYNNHINVYGKICVNCGFYIKPDNEPPIVQYIKYKNDMIKKTILNYLKGK
jgi:hypothetical protein